MLLVFSLLRSKNPSLVPLYPTKKRKKAIRCSAAFGFFHFAVSLKQASLAAENEKSHPLSWMAFLLFGCGR